MNELFKRYEEATGKPYRPARSKDSGMTPRSFVVIFLLVALLVSVLGFALATMRTYEGGGAAGIAWDWGGFEYRGDPGLFLCPGNYDPANDSYIRYPWADWFPQLITDC